MLCHAGIYGSEGDGTCMQPRLAGPLPLGGGRGWSVISHGPYFVLVFLLSILFSWMATLSPARITRATAESAHWWSRSFLMACYKGQPPVYRQEDIAKS